MRPAALLTRLVAAWVLFGAVLKLLHGSPADLPRLVRDLPLASATTFTLVIGLEMVVGITALARPSRGWVPILLLLVAFLAVLGVQVADGADSCGCFGAALVIAPELMLAIEAALALALVLARPWRLEPGRGELPWAAVLLFALAGAVLPTRVDREATAVDAGGGGGGATRKWVEFDVASWKGKRLGETQLYPWLRDAQRIETGVIVIWRASCEVCAEHLEKLAAEEQGDRDVVLLELPPEREDEHRAVQTLPLGAWVLESRLPDTFIWLVTPPAHVEVRDGVVVKALEGMDVLR